MDEGTSSYRNFHSPFYQGNVLISTGFHFFFSAEPRNIRDRFKDMDRIFKKRKDISRKQVYPIFVKEDRANPLVVKTVLP